MIVSRCSVFEQIANRYDRHAVLENEVGQRLSERLVFQRIEPRSIVDLGCGTGTLAARLKRQYRPAEVLGIDISAAMCRRTRHRSTWRRPLRVVCADLCALPLAAGSVDLLISNLALPWCTDFAAIFAGFRRVLRPGGLLLFSSLGPASMREWRSLDEWPGVLHPDAGFVDMHELGDVLVAAGFAEPVMDSEIVTLSYRNLDDLIDDLDATGASSHLLDWPPQEPFLDALRKAYPPSVQPAQLPLSWEIVYGMAFGPPEGQPIRGRDGDTATFSVAALRESITRKR